MNVYFVSEDKENSPFVELYRKAYDFKVLDCSNGNTYLVDKVTQLSKTYGEDACFVVYLDVVPDNAELARIYDDLLALVVSKVVKNMVVLPIPCAEYAFIRSVHDIPSAIHSSDGLAEVLSKSASYKESSLSLRLDNPPKSFERFCKRFCRMCLNDKCCSVKSNDVSDRPYFSGDCVCDGCETRLTLREKAIRYVCQLHIFPASDVFTDVFSSWDDVIRYSWPFVDEYNDWASMFSPRGRPLMRFPLSGR